MDNLKAAKLAYYSHKYNAKQRQIEFKLTFDEWWALWKPHFYNRGNKKGQFVMCRKLDSGAYEIGNVSIGTVDDNARTRAVVSLNKRYKEIQKEWEGFSKDYSEDDEDGWLPKELKNPFKSSWV